MSAIVARQEALEKTNRQLALDIQVKHSYQVVWTVNNFVVVRTLVFAHVLCDFLVQVFVMSFFLNSGMFVAGLAFVFFMCAYFPLVV